jgi:energy-coupling factor transport system substrate-specific component
MKELFTMWKNTRMILLVALCAAVYAAVLIVFKAGIVLIPGITEVRPANLLPIVFSLLFGPAAA